MKTKRQKLICDIIKEHNIETQEELASILDMRGFSVTQTTVSRDIKELKLIKVPSGDGTYKYTLPELNSVGNKYDTAFFERYLIKVAMSGTIVVLNTFGGSAELISRAVEAMKEDYVLGTIAGFDTVFVAADSIENARKLALELRQYIKKQRV